MGIVLTLKMPFEGVRRGSFGRNKREQIPDEGSLIGPKGKELKRTDLSDSRSRRLHESGGPRFHVDCGSVHRVLRLLLLLATASLVLQTL